MDQKVQHHAVQQHPLQNQTVKAQRPYLQVAGQLMDLIKRGAFKPGQHLPSERDLAHEFGVSRPTVREAMIAMEIAGVIEVRSESGVYVLEPGTRAATVVDDPGPGPFELLEARRVVEGEVCALAAERITDQQLARLVELVGEMEQENPSDGAAEEADQQFHFLIAEVAGNSALTATIAWLWDLRNKSEISIHFHRRIREEGIKPIIADHRAILEALRQRDSVAARQAMNLHMQRVVEHLLGTR